MKANNRFNLTDMQDNLEFQGFMTYDSRFNLSDSSSKLCHYGLIVFNDNIELFNILNLKGEFLFQWQIQHKDEYHFHVFDKNGLLIFYGRIIQ